MFASKTDVQGADLHTSSYSSVDVMRPKRRRGEWLNLTGKIQTYTTILITNSQQIPEIYKSSEFKNQPFMVSQQRQTPIVPEIPPDDREDKQQHL